jgi:hypothetical protein
MANNTKESGSMGLRRDKASGKVFLETHISVSGHRVKQTAMAFISGRMETGTKVNGNSV